MLRTRSNSFDQANQGPLSWPIFLLCWPAPSLIQVAPRRLWIEASLLGWNLLGIGTAMICFSTQPPFDCRGFEETHCVVACQLGSSPPEVSTCTA